MSFPPPPTAPDAEPRGSGHRRITAAILPRGCRNYCADAESIGASGGFDFRRLIGVTADPEVRNFLWRMLSIEGRRRG